LSCFHEPNSTTISFDLATYATDFIPDTLAAGNLRHLIRQDDEQLKALENEIAQLQASLFFRMAQRSEVPQSHNLRRAFLAPILKLAPKLLGEVFTHILGTWRLPMEEPDVRGPLLHVCKRWLRIAIGTPALWTRLRIGKGDHHSIVPICLQKLGLSAYPS